MYTTVEELSDFNGSLEKLLDIVERLIEKHGKDTNIETDAGYNNVSFLISIK